MKTFEITVMTATRERSHQVEAFGWREAMEEATRIAADSSTDIVRISVEETEYLY